jgi:hypothetical protein
MTTLPTPELNIEDEPLELKRAGVYTPMKESGYLKFVENLVTMIAGREFPTNEENSDGSQKYRLMTEDEIISRAFSLTEKTYQEAIKRGYAFTLPPLDEMKRDWKPGFKVRD